MAKKCSRCRERNAEVYLAYSNLNLCADCFLILVERKVKHAINAYRMIARDDRIGIAVSGGKDSATLAYIMNRLYSKIDMVLIYIDLGIPEYSAHCLGKVKELAKMLDREIVIYSLEKELGFSIGDFKSTIYGRKICSACGAVKRYLFNKIAYDMGLTKIATGHNLDDTVEALFNFYLEGNITSLLRLKPFLPKTHPKLVPKIKPLIGLTDMECMFYAAFRDLPVREINCQFSVNARSIKRKELLNMITERIPAFKHMFIRSHFKRILPMLEEAAKDREIKIYECPICGMPTSIKDRPCHFCKLVTSLKKRGIK
ncbi:adenine nucleotide alpha hydrolase family protein [Candidatus Bathyarchaeota archaeon]|nr:adenine nucleotide alpha hydrolase family protein [Candidatus Bathyarchaeota archaeon]